MKKLSVLLVEDEIDLAKNIIDYLELDGITCEHASNGISGLNFINSKRYDMVMLDINIPRMSGLMVCQKLRESGNDTPILMITARDTLDDKLTGFKMGTDDYLVKPFELPELVARINALASRRSNQAITLSLYGLVIDINKKIATRDDRVLRLSPIGWTLLETLMRSSPQIVSRDKLTHAIWGDNIPDSDSLKVHLYQLRKEVDTINEIKLIHTFSKQGIAFKR